MQEMMRLRTVVAGMHAVDWVTRRDFLVDLLANRFFRGSAGVHNVRKPFTLCPRGFKRLRVIAGKNDCRSATDVITRTWAPVSVARPPRPVLNLFLRQCLPHQGD